MSVDVNRMLGGVRCTGCQGEALFVVFWVLMKMWRFLA